MVGRHNFERIDSVCEAGGSINEDVVGFTVSGGWVIDGATGVMGVKTLSCRSDAAWFADRIDRALRAEVDETARSLDILQKVVATVAAEFTAISTRPDAATAEKPSASLVMVRSVKNEEIEQTVLGDCSILQRNPDGRVANFCHSGITALDQELADELVRLRVASASSSHIAARIQQMERRIRSKMNSDEGYWILDTEGGGIKSSLVRCDAALPESSYLILSDGFRRLVDTYRAYDDESLIRAAFEPGLRALYQQLRNIEADDPEATSFPRIKHRDDASALLLRLSP
jgi:hypothetical protein